MAALIGKDGGFAIGASVVGMIDTWTLSPKVNTHEVTGFLDPSRQYAYGIKEWAGTASGTLNKADAQQITLTNQVETAALAVVALRLATTTTLASYWGGNAYITGATVNSAVADKVSVSFNFQGTGNLTYTSS